MTRTRVFVSFDTVHDQDLYALLVAQSRTPRSGFSVLGGSEGSMAASIRIERARQMIQEADQMIVICGEHTESSTRVSDELRIAVELETPHFLLWGRRESMCTKPPGARPSEGMYGWTLPTVQDQIALTLRKTSVDATAGRLRSAARKA